MGIAAPVFITHTRRVALSWALSQRLKDPAPLALDLQQNSQSASIHILGTLQQVVGQGRGLAEAASVGAVLDPQSLPGPLPSACGIMSEYLDVSFAGNTSEECFGFSPAAMQVACSAQLLNITDPPRCGLLPAAVPRRRCLRCRPIFGSLASFLCPAFYSIYSWEEDSFLWEPVTCMLANVTYSNRIDLAGALVMCGRHLMPRLSNVGQRPLPLLLPAVSIAG